MDFILGAVIGFISYPFLMICGKAIYRALSKTSKKW